MMKYAKYHGLGNDYIVMTPEDLGGVDLTPERIVTICHRNYGVGSDGILLGPLSHDGCDFGVRIFNPDGGEAEKSGNGIRIFARYLWDTGQVGGEPFTIGTLGGPVKAQLFDNAQRIRVEMGTVSFSSDKIPVAGPSREVINETITVCGQPLTFCAATIGNPHCVVPCEDLAQVDVHGLGAALEVEARFPNRTNVQFLKVLDKNNIRI